jgi:hypothetical protein
MFGNDPDKIRLYTNLCVELAGYEPETIVPVLAYHLRVNRNLLLNKTNHVSKELHKCKDCELGSGSKCKIFNQSTALMETMFAYRQCCFKEVKEV